MRTVLKLATAFSLTLVASLPVLAQTASDTTTAPNGTLRAEAQQLHQEGDALRAKQADLQKERQAHRQKVEALRSKAQTKRAANLEQRQQKIQQRLTEINSRKAAGTAGTTTPDAAVK